MKALRKRLISHHNAVMVAAWHAAAMPLMKEFPKLKDLLIEDGAPYRGRRQSREELIANLKAAFGFSGTEH